MGFSPDVRLVTTDLGNFARRAPQFVRHIRAAAGKGPVNILALSGGGSEGAFGAGALVGMTEAGTRPRFQLVTGVSAGALIAPFAFLGPDWDRELAHMFTRDQSRLLSGSVTLRFVGRLLSPLDNGRHDALYDLVDKLVSPALVKAVARASATGRELVVATTDLDTQETVLWNMSAIARHGGSAARRLFRNVLLASASLPGIFPPVLLNVKEGQGRYQELHVDGGVTTSVFIFPMIASISPDHLPPLRGAHLYMIVNGQLVSRPETTPVKTLDVLSRSFSAQLTYRTRQAILNAIQVAHHLDMPFHLTEIPVDYPVTSFVNFKPDYMRALFEFGERCAKAGRLWLTPEQSVRRNKRPLPPATSGAPRCPGVLTAVHQPTSG